jgi:hypothetical protein
MTTPKLHARNRRPLIAQQFLENTPLSEIATHFNVTLNTVKNDIQAHFETQSQNSHLDPQEQLAIEIAALNRVERFAWEGHKDDTQAYRFLRIILECTKLRSILLQLQDQIALPPVNQEIINTIHIIRDQVEQTPPKRK